MRVLLRLLLPVTLFSLPAFAQEVSTPRSLAAGESLLPLAATAPASLALVRPVRPALARCTDATRREPQCRFRWKKALLESAEFLAVQHSMNTSTYHGTLQGPFFRDWFRSLKHYRFSRWSDDDPFIVNYVGHPMMGGVAARIQIQNDPLGSPQQVGWNRGYWKSRGKALAWASVYAAQWELGPFSETSIGNLGSFTYYQPAVKHLSNGTGLTDMVTTPVVGTALTIGEDLIDKYALQRMLARTGNPFLRTGLSVLNPTRSFANLLRFKPPWYRDRATRPAPGE